VPPSGGSGRCWRCVSPASTAPTAGRAINSFEPEWPKSLTGFAKVAYDFWQKELEPQGLMLRAQIMDFPSGMPGDVGMFLGW
jgi:hypothetical protein